MALFITYSVGKGGVNLGTDVIAVKEAINEIPPEYGAPSEVLTLDGGVTTELIDAIFNFQAFHHLPSVDGLINRDKATHKQINLVLDHLAAPPPTVTVSPVPAGMPMTVGPITITVADPNSLPGLAQLQRKAVGCAYQRRLIHVNGSSINWIGVVVPSPLPSDGILGIPNLFFTPTPIQGGYSDSGYHTFNGWYPLWDDYTSIIGSQLVAAGVKQVLVIPFYRTAQQQDLGSFLFNWRAAVSEAVSAAVNSMDPLYLSGDYTFQRIASSSFSNGWVAHHEFSTKGFEAAGMTNVLIDLDGAAANSTWEPPNGVIYRNRAAPGGVNPSGRIFYVGGRWNQFVLLYAPDPINTHACCRNHLVYHGLQSFGF